MQYVIDRLLKNSEKIFLLGISLISTHELDAMTHEEWGLLLPFLEPKIGESTFVILHIPLFMFLYHFISHQSSEKRLKFKKYFSVFLFIHGLAHFTFSLFHASYSFKPPIESITVYGASICGALFLFCESKRATALSLR